MQTRRYSAALLLALIVSVTACGGDDDSPAPAGPPSTVAPAAPTVSLTYGIKQLQFSWAAVSGATHYRLLERPDATSAFAQIGADVSATAVNHEIALHRRVNAAYRVDACNSAGCTASNTIGLAANLLPAIGYFKASNTGDTHRFGWALALSADGTTMAIGAIGDASGAPGVNGNQLDTSAPSAGAVHVFSRVGGVWAQQAYLKASSPEPQDNFGYTLALNADGSTLVATAFGEDSSATGVDGNQSDNAAANAGAVYVFARSAGTWSQQAYLKASNTGASDRFGTALAVSTDGSTLAVGASGEASNATGMNGDQLNNLAGGSGAVYIFTRSAATWSQQAYIKASNTEINDAFGLAVALSSDGTILAVGAGGEDSSATGIGGDQLNNLASTSGAAYIFAQTAGVWSQQAYIKASNTENGDQFGEAIALSADGSTLVVGASREDSASTSINANQTDNSALNSGAVYVFVRNAGVWTQQAYLKSSNAEANDVFGLQVAVNTDGSTVAVAAFGEDSNATGINGGQTDNSTPSGAVYVFSRSAAVWTQQAYVKASNGEASDLFGNAIALSADGATLAIPASAEDSSSTGIGGNQLDNSVANSGAVYLF